ncbi:MAG: LAGLIDADG family homing endonuclease [Candidatus Micrarchaeota archaeon]
MLAHACLTGDTLIQLADGKITEIKSLSVNDHVISMGKDLKNKNSGLSAKVVKEGIGTIYEIDTGHKIKASPLHKFFILDGFEIKEIRAKEIKNGDYLVHCDMLHFDGTVQTLPVVEQEELAVIKPEKVEQLRRLLLKTTRKELCKELAISPRQFRRMLNQGYPTTVKNIGMLANEVGEETSDYFEPYFSHKHREIAIPEKLGIDLSQVFGYFLGDGNIDTNSLRFRDERKEVLEEYQKILKGEFNLEGSISKITGKNCYELRLNSRTIRNLFEKTEIGLFTYVSKSPLEHVAAFIKGFADAEGYVSKTRPRIQIGQKDEKTLQFIQLLLLRFGIRSRILDSTRCKTLLIDGKEVVGFANNIGMTASDKKNLLEKWCTHYKSTYTRQTLPISRKSVKELLLQHGLPVSTIKAKETAYKNINIREAKEIVSTFSKKSISCKEIEFLRTWLDGNIRFERVRKVKEKENTECLFDITVPVHENFVANGFVVHNSTYRLYLRKGKEDKRIARLVDSPNLPEGECVFKVTKKGVHD